MELKGLSKGSEESKEATVKEKGEDDFERHGDIPGPIQRSPFPQIAFARFRLSRDHPANARE